MKGISRTLDLLESMVKEQQETSGYPVTSRILDPDIATATDYNIFTLASVRLS